MNKIIITNKIQDRKISGKVKKIVEIVLKILKQKDIQLHVYFVNDKEMKKINAKFRDKNKATNVLSFSEPKFFPHPEFGDQTSDVRGQRLRFRYLGELYLAPNYIQQKKEDMKLMVVHGILHLLGYTHTRKSDIIRMEKAEKKLLKEISHQNESE